MTTPSNGIPWVPENTQDPAAGLNDALRVIDALMQVRVLSMDQTAPPVSPADGDRHIVATGATGAWAGHEDELARYVAEGAFWQFYPTDKIACLFNEGDGGLYVWDGGWQLAAGLGDAPADGTEYVRKDGAWKPATGGGGGGLSDAPNDGTLYGRQNEAWAAVPAPGIGDAPSDGISYVRRDGAWEPDFPSVVAASAETTNATAAGFGRYTRFTHAAAKYHFDGTLSFAVGAEYHGRYAGAGTLTITTDNGFAVNAPTGGTLTIPAGGTFTIKIVGALEADLFGVTEPAP